MSSKIIIRGLWTSYNYVIPEKYSPDIVVGGVVDI